MGIIPMDDYLLTAAETVLIYLYAGYCLPRREYMGSRLVVLPMMLLSGVVLFLNNLYLSRISAFFTFLLLDLLFISVAFKGDFIQKLHLKLQFDAINIILEVWVISMIAVFAPYPISNPRTGDYLQIIATCLSRGLLLLVMLLFCQSLSTWNKQLNHARLVRNVAFYCLFWLTVTFIYPIDVEAEQYRYLLTLNSSVTVTGLLFAGAAFYDQRKWQQNLLAEQQQQAYDNLTRWHVIAKEALQHHREEIGRREHNLRHHYNYIKTLIEKQEYHKAGNYMMSVTRQWIDYEPICTGNIDIDTIIGGKELDIAGRGVMLSVSSEGLPQSIAIPTIDMCLLLGNLLDNAVEASVRPEQSGFEKKVELIFRYTNGALFIDIANPIRQKAIGSNFFLSKKAHSHNHGYGLIIVDEIVKRYNGFRETKIINEKLHVTVYLHLPDHYNKEETI